MSSPRPAAPAAAFWFFAALVVFWFGNWGHSLWDRDEPRYAVATREMIAGGDWIVPYFNHEYRFDKPILIYWLMSVPMRLSGVNEFSVRAVSGVAGAATVALLFVLSLRMGADRGGAHVAALTAFVSPLLLVISKAATTDAVLVLTVVGALALHWEQRRSGFSWIRHVAFWAVIGLSILDKGPPGPLVVGLAVGGERLWRWRARNVDDASPALRLDMGPTALPRSRRVAIVLAVVRLTIGILVLLAVALPWAWAAWDATDGAFFQVAIGRHVIERAAVSLESHGGPFVYYLPVLFAGVFPLTALVVAACRWAWSARRVAPLRLLWCWLIPPFIVFSFAKTKLPHYVSPLVPALALMAGLWWTVRHAEHGPEDSKPHATDADTSFDSKAQSLAETGRIAKGWIRFGAIFTGLFGFVGGVALPIAAAIAPFPRLIAPGIVLGVLLATSSVAGSVYWWRRRRKPALVLWVAGFLAFVAVGFLWGVPELEPLRPAKQVVEWVRAHAPPGTELMAVDYQEPSLVFYWKGHVHMFGKSEQEEGLYRLSQLDRPLALVITETRWQKWIDRYPSIVSSQVGVRFHKKFYLFQKGRWERLVIVGNWPLSSDSSTRR